MRAINLYALTRNVEPEILPIFEKNISWREEKLRIRESEIALIRTIVANLMFFHASKDCFDDWFYSFTIPQISKEFDLLKIGENGITVNVELKEQVVEEERIIKQLKQNRYYLSNVATTIYSYTYMQVDNTHYKILKLINDSLVETTFEDIIGNLHEVENPYTEDIEKHFRPKDYLISPINTPKKFLDGEYFLTNQQESIKKSILEGLLDGDKLWGIRGSAGTGKTLLLYDMARFLSNDRRVCIIHSGILAEGHKIIDEQLADLSIIEAKSALKETLEQFDFICVDETQRLYASTLASILELYNEGIIEGCIFSYDFAQCLSKKEIRRNNPHKLRNINGFQEMKLSDRIRTNKVIFSFIRTMLRLTEVPRKPMNYDCIDIMYANDITESDKLLRLYRNKGYTFITFTPSQFVSNGIDHYSANINSHQVIGQEFDNVVIIMDNNFRYSDDGDLEGKEHPNPDYLFPRLFYQNISRTRERLCIIVLNNPKMFRKLLMIKENEMVR